MNKRVAYFVRELGDVIQGHWIEWTIFHTPAIAEFTKIIIFLVVFRFPYYITSHLCFRIPLWVNIWVDRLQAVTKQIWS